MLFDARFQGAQILRCRVPIDEERANSSAKEVIGTTGTKRSELLRPFRSGEGEGIRIVAVMRDHSPVRGHGSAQSRQNRRGNCFTIGERRMLKPAKETSLL